jgi:hypothetical protein
MQIAGGGAETIMVFKKRVVLNKAQAAQERLRKEHEALGIIAPMPKQSPPHVNQLSGMSSRGQENLPDRYSKKSIQALAK